MKTAWIYLFLLGMIAPSFLWAQSDKHHHQPNPEMRAALKAHFQQQMLPILKEKHQQFDAALPAADLTFLQAERSKADQLREQRQALHKIARQYGKQGKTHDEIKALLQPQHEQLRSQKEALAKEMEPFIQRNQALVDRFVQELEPLHQQWREQRKAIHEQYRPADAPQPQEHAHKKGGKGNCPNPQAKGDGPDHKTRQVMRFLLWNGEEPEEHPHHHLGARLADENVPNSDSNLPQPANTLSLFPNPAMDNTTVKFTLGNDVRNASLKIMNSNGQMIREINLGNLSSGTHNNQVALQDLPSGNYFCVLNADGVQQTQPFIIKR